MVSLKYEEMPLVQTDENFKPILPLSFNEGRALQQVQGLHQGIPTKSYSEKVREDQAKPSISQGMASQVSKDTSREVSWKEQGQASSRHRYQERKAPTAAVPDMWFQFNPSSPQRLPQGTQGGVAMPPTSPTSPQVDLSGDDLLKAVLEVFSGQIVEDHGSFN